jgi:hypothetical protein
MVSGSAGAAGAQGASNQLARCERPLGTAALVEPDAQAITSLQSLGLQSPIPLLRLMMAQSNCFQVVDRGAALGNIEREQALRQQGLLQSGSVTAQGRMITVQYLITPNVIFSNPNAGGMSAAAGLGSFFGTAGALAGAVAGSMRVQEAQTALFLTDAQTGVQSGVAEGSARVRDFGGAAGIAGFGGGIGGLAGIGGYGNTAEGKLIVAAFLDAHNKLVEQVRLTVPNLPPVSAPTQPRQPAYDPAMVRDIQTALQARGLYRGTVDGVYGPGTRNAIMEFQRSRNATADGVPSPSVLGDLRQP